MCRDQFLFFRKVKKIYKNKKINKNHGGIVYSDLKYVCSASLGGCGRSAGGGGGAGKQMKEGWGLTGVHVGIWGWATVEHPPRYCLLCQAESVFFSKKPELICQPQQTLSISTGLTPHPHLL